MRYYICIFLTLSWCKKNHRTLSLNNVPVLCQTIPVHTFLFTKLKYTSVHYVQFSWCCICYKQGKSVFFRIYNIKLLSNIFILVKVMGDICVQIGYKLPLILNVKMHYDHSILSWIIYFEVHYQLLKFFRNFYKLLSCICKL